MSETSSGVRITGDIVAGAYVDSRDWFSQEERVYAHRTADADSSLNADEPDLPAKYIITGPLGSGKSVLGTLLARRLRKRNENLAHNGNIWLGVSIAPAIYLLEQLPNLPEKTVVVLTDDVYIGGANPSPPKDWWDNLVPFDAVIVTSAISPEEFHTQGGLPPLEDLQADPTVAFCTPTRCALGVIEWLQNGEEKSATEAEALLAQKLTDTFASIHFRGGQRNAR